MITFAYFLLTLKKPRDKTLIKSRNFYGPGGNWTDEHDQKNVNTGNNIFKFYYELICLLLITIQQIINTKKGKSAHSLFAYLLNIIVWIYIFHFCKNTVLKSAALKQKALKINSFVKMETVNYPWLLKKDKKGECFALEKNEYYENNQEYFGS